MPRDSRIKVAGSIGQPAQTLWRSHSPSPNAEMPKLPRMSIIGQIEIDGQDYEIWEPDDDAHDREGRRCFDALFDHTPIGAVITSQDGNMLVVNRSFCNMLGYAQHELVGKTFMEITHADDRLLAFPYRDKLLNGDIESYQLEKRYIAKNGTIVWARLTSSSVQGEASSPSYFIAQIEDITPFKQHLSKLTESEAEHRHLIENLPYGVIIHREGNILMANAEAAKLFRARSAADLLGINPLTLIHPDYRKIVIDRLEDVIDKGIDSPAIEEKLLKLDGTVFHAQVSAISVLFENRKASCAVFVDITPRKMVEETLHFLSKSRWDSSHEAFLPELCRFFSAILGVDYVYVGRLLDDQKFVQTTAFLAQGELLDNFCYSLQGTPCANVVGKELCVYPEAVKMHFPDDHFLADKGIEGYAGIPLWDSRGKPLGLFAVMHRHKLDDINLIGSHLHLVSMRVASEIERQDSERNEQRLLRTNTLLSRSDALLIRASDEPNLLADTCRLAVDVGGYLMSWVGYAEHDEVCTVTPVAQAGYVEHYLEKANIRWSDTPAGQGPVGRAIRTGATAVIRHFQDDPATILWRDDGSTMSYRSCCALPLILQNEVIGAFSVYSQEDEAFHSSEVTLLESLANDLAFGILALRTRKEKDRAIQSLQHESQKNLALLRNASDGIHIVDQDGHIVEASDSFCMLLGYPREEVIGMNVVQWDAHFTGPDEAMTLVRDQFQKPGRSQFETKHRRKDGTLFDVEVSGIRIDLEGKTVLFNSSRDITQRKKIERDLMEEKERFQAQQEFLNTILENEPECVKVLSHHGYLIQMNRAGLDMLEVASEDEVRNIGLINFVLPEYRQAFNDLTARIFRGETGRFEFQIVGKQGTLRWVATHAVPIRNASGNITAMLGVTRDVTKQKQSELALLQHIEFTEGVMDAIPDLMCELDSEGKYINLWTHDPALLSNQKEFLLGKSVADVLSEDAAKTVMSALKEASLLGRSKGQIISLDLPQGKAWFELSTAMISINRLHEQHFLMLSRDVTDRKLSEEKIQQLAYYDQLTALPNRQLFRDRLEKNMQRAKRNLSSLALLFIDLDRFKEVNDTLGHDKGDELLIAAANRIGEYIKRSDTFARLGGDEFAIILPDCDEPSTIDRLVQNILHALEQPFDLGHGTCHISGSIGITLYPREAENIDDLLKQADQAMYAAKLGGRNRFSYFTRSMQAAAQEKVYLTNELRHALEHRELQVHFQPIVELATGKIEKAEALLRWHHPTRGPIGPATFIPLAEESGLILEIGEWVFLEAIRNILAWREHTGQLIQVSVNKSPLQFNRTEKHPWLEHHQRSGLPEKCITVEITEGLLLSESEKVHDELKYFQQNGIEVSIDDFGTGFSSLSYLKKFDIDYLKIDQSFVRNLTTDESDKALVEAIIVMAHKLKIKTIAEGVETEAQRDLLIAFNCDYVQGYFFSRPIPADAFEALIKVHHGKNLSPDAPPETNFA